MLYSRCLSFLTLTGFMNLNQITIPVSDLERTIVFYENLCWSEPEKSTLANLNLLACAPSQLVI